MYITCLDVEGVLVPEIWIAFAEASGIPELKKTTRDEPDYDKLMNWRLGILKEHGLGLKEIQETIAKIDPLPGAREFLDELRTFSQVILISDTFITFTSLPSASDIILMYSSMMGISISLSHSIFAITCAYTHREIGEGTGHSTY